MAWSFIGEGFDIAGDYGMFMGIHAAYHDTAESRAKVAPVYIASMVAVIVCTLISVVAVVIRIALFLKQMRRRRRELRGIGRRQEYGLLLDGKIEDAKRQCVQVYIGIALACCEDLPMGGIGIYFLSTKFAIPPFIIVSLFTSGLLLGTKFAAVSTLPYWFGKLNKWKANRPARKCRATGRVSTDLESSVPSFDLPVPKLALSVVVPCRKISGHVVLPIVK